MTKLLSTVHTHDLKGYNQPPKNAVDQSRMRMFSFKAPKSYKIYKIVDRPRNAFTLFTLALIASMYLLVLGMPGAVRHSIRLQIRAGDVKLAIRHTMFLTNLSWLPTTISGDSYFNASQDMSSGALTCLIKIVERKITDPFKRHATLADLYGGLLHNLCTESGGHITNSDPKVKALEQQQNLHLKKLYQHIQPSELNPQLVDSDKLNKNLLSKSDALAALHDVVNLFESAGMRFYIISGTLLGAVREKDFLSHDYDIDIGVHYEELDAAKLYNTVEKTGKFVVTAKNDLVKYTKHSCTGITEYQRLDKPILIKLCHHTGLHIDVFTHIKEGDVRWHGSPIHRWDNKEFELATYQLAGIEVLGPKDYDTYLTENYGDWRTPRTNFNSSIDTPNMEFSRSTKALTYFARAARDLYQYNRDEDAERLLAKIMVP